MVLEPLLAVALITTTFKGSVANLSVEYSILTLEEPPRLSHWIVFNCHAFQTAEPGQAPGHVTVKSDRTLKGLFETSVTLVSPSRMIFTFTWLLTTSETFHG